MNNKKIKPFAITLTMLLLIGHSLVFFETVHAISTSNESISPSTFSPDGNGLNDSVTITFQSTSGQTLYLNIYYNLSELVRSDITVSEVSSGSYSATWNGKDDNNSYVTDESEAYVIRVTDVYGGGGSETTIGTCNVDVTPPTSALLSINGGATYSTDDEGNVNLTISATGASKMKVSNYANFSGATWENYATTKAWTLLNPSSDGTKTVYINFRDTAGANVSTSDTITLDTTLADPALSIESGASTINSTSVSLSITANGASQMKIDNNTGFGNMTSWIDKVSTYNFTMPSGEGQKRIYLRVRDEAGNTKTTSDTITLDTTAPTNLSISINNGSSYTNSTSVYLSLSAEGGPSTMYLSNNGSIWSSYSYATSKSWTLSSTEGSKTVYFKVADAAGNNATSITATITLDTTDPSQVSLSSPSAGATVTTQTPQFTWTNPNPSGTKNFYIEILQSGVLKQSDYTNASTLSYNASTLAEGSYQWRVTVYDMANNSATTSQRSFTLTVDGLAIPSPTYPTIGAKVNNSAPNMIRLRWSQVSGQGTIYYDYKHATTENGLQNATSNSTTSLYAQISGYTQGQTVYWIVRARNTTDTTNYSSVRSFTVDNVSPVMNSIAIASGSTYTASRSVSLSISATGANWIKISEDQDWANTSWVTFAASKSYTLSSGDGLKTVYIVTKDNAVGDQGSTTYANINLSAISDSITLDTTGPTISNGFPSSSTSDSTPEISADITDSYAGVDTSTLIIIVDGVNQTTNATITSSEVTYTPSSALSDGSITVNISVADNVSNIGYLEWSFTVSTDDGGDDDNDGGSDPGGGLPPPGDTTATISITDISHNPTSITSDDTVTISATITATNGVHKARIYYTTDGDLDSALMTSSSGDTYTATIGPFTEGTTITYYIHVTDLNAETADSENNSFTIQDTKGPTITLVSPSKDASITDTTPEIIIRYSDPSGIDTSSISITLDGNDITSLVTISSSELTYIPITALSLGTYSISITVEDEYGNEASASWNFTIVEKTSELVETIDTIAADESQTIQFDSENSYLSEIKITAGTDLENVTISIHNYDTKPGGITEPTNTVYMYIEISTNVADEDLKSLTLSFKVENEWLENHNIDQKNIVLLRYHNNNWQTLTTTVTSKDETHTYFDAITPGLSTFAIGVSSGTEIVGEIPWIIIIAGIIAAAIIAFIVLFKMGYLYFDHEEE